MAKLFKVQAVYFVAADNADAAGIVPTDVDPDFCAKEVESLADIPEDWRDALPENGDRACREYVVQGHNESAPGWDPVLSVRIEGAICATAKEFALRVVSGRYLRGIDHQSLVVDTQRQVYAWNAMGEFGNVVDWVQKRKKTDYAGAVEWLKKLEKRDPEIEMQWMKDEIDPDMDDWNPDLYDLGALKEVDVLAVQAGDGKN